MDLRRVCLIGLLLLVSPWAVAQSELHCLAETLYYEARGEPVDGIIEVGQVVLNRVTDSRWPKTVCAVVWEPGQFEWTRKVRDRTKREPRAWHHSQVIAKMLLQPKRYRFHNAGSTHFVEKSWHKRVSWTNELDVSRVVGRHVFYY